MKHRIDPTVDCVLKAILGRESNKPVLIHFLNSVLQLEPEKGIKEVGIINPYNERQFMNDKLTVVDVKAVDEQGNHYQIEIQLELKQALRERMLYTWSSIYHSLLHKGESFDGLKKVISIWIVGENLYPDVDDHHLHFSINDSAHKILLTDHLEIHVLQLPKWQWQGVIQEALDLWMLLFTEGGNIDVDDPPEEFQIEVMSMVLETLKQFSEDRDDYLLYESRRIAQIQANTDDKWKANTLAEMKQLKAEKKQMEAEVQQKDEEIARLHALLEKFGVNPDLK